MIIFTDYDHIKTAFKTTKGKVKLILVDENDSFFEFLKSGQQYINRICDIEKISLSCSQEYFADMVSMLIYKAKLNNEEVSYLFSKEICDKIETNLSSCFYDIAVKIKNKCKNEIKREQTKTTSGKTKEQIKKDFYRYYKKQEFEKLLILLYAFPSLLSMTALYKLLSPMGLINTRTGLVIVYTGTMAVFALWNMKVYFKPN